MCRTQQDAGRMDDRLCEHLSIKPRKLVSVPLDDSARLRACVLSVVNYLHAVDENFRDAGRQLAGLLKSGVVLDGAGIEDRNVRKVSLSQQTAIGNAEVGCRETGHLANGFRHGYDFFIADITGIDASKISERARMRAEFQEDPIDALGGSVRTKTHPGKRDLFADIILAHQEINRLDAIASGVASLGSARHSRALAVGPRDFSSLSPRC